MVWWIILGLVLVLAVLALWRRRQGRGVAGRGVDSAAVNRAVESLRRKGDDQPQGGGPGLWGG